MTMLVDIEAFLATARAGSFSGAARSLGVAPSVITKRVGRLEEEVGFRLFARSTRRLSVTSEGERLRPKLQSLLGELHEALHGDDAASDGLRGQIRVKAPTTIGTLYVGQSIARFQAANPHVSIELLLIDRSVNPLEEGLDLALGALPQSYASVVETPLCPYDRIVVAAPSYLARAPAPREPADIAEHNCLTFVPVGLSWAFLGDKGPVAVDVRSSFTVNDSRLLVAAAEEGLGLSVVPEFLARESLAAGRLIQVMADRPVVPLWFKAMVPRTRAHRAEVAALLEHLRQEFETPPWDR